MRGDRVVVGAVGDRGDADRASLRVSRDHSQAGAEVVHLGAVATADVLARTAVAEDARRVLLVGADDTGAAVLRDALHALGADDVDVEVVAT